MAFPLASLGISPLFAVTLKRASRVKPHNTKAAKNTWSSVVRRPMLNATQAGARPKEICRSSS